MEAMKKYDRWLPVYILIALGLGVALGRWCVGNERIVDVVVPVASWMGTSFMNLLKVLVIPLVFSSLVSGVMNLGSGRHVGRLGAKTLGMYMLTTLIAVVTGLALVDTIRPGEGAPLQNVTEIDPIGGQNEGFTAFLQNIFPSNIVESMASGEMLHVILFAILFGIFAMRLGEDRKQFLNEWFSSVFDVMMHMTGWVVRLAPLGVLGLVTREVARHGDIAAIASSLGLFMVTVSVGLFFHFFVTLPVLVRLLSGVHPYRHLRNMTTPLLTAFTTASSSATLPLTLEAVEKRSGVSKKVASFTLPLGATINMDGTALFECVAAIFVAQAYGVDLSLGAQVVVVVTALVTSIGAAGIPMASFVMLVIVLTAVGLPIEGLSLILAVDFLLDMMRTATNVWSDTCVTVIVAHSEGEKLSV